MTPELNCRIRSGGDVEQNNDNNVVAFGCPKSRAKDRTDATSPRWWRQSTEAHSVSSSTTKRLPQTSSERAPRRPLATRESQRICFPSIPELSKPALGELEWWVSWDDLAVNQVGGMRQLAAATQQLLQASCLHFGRREKAPSSLQLLPHLAVRNGEFFCPPFGPELLFSSLARARFRLDSSSGPGVATGRGLPAGLPGQDGPKSRAASLAGAQQAERRPRRRGLSFILTGVQEGLWGGGGGRLSTRVENGWVFDRPSCA